MVPGLPLNKLRVGVDDAGCVGRARTVVKIGEHLVIAFFRFTFRDATSGIVLVAEDDGIGRAGLLTGCQDIAVSDRAVFLIRRKFRFLDALDANRCTFP